jgi:hypothetical protein
VKHCSLFGYSVPQDVIAPVVEAAIPQVPMPAVQQPPVVHLPQDFQQLAQAPAYLWPESLAHLPLEVVQLCLNNFLQTL